jgi:hypothetical protein
LSPRGRLVAYGRSGFVRAGGDGGGDPAELVDLLGRQPVEDQSPRRTVVHAPILGGAELRDAFVLVPAAGYRPPLMFPSITRTDVAALMLQEASHPRFGAETAVFARR